jgi:hypothetical protein
VSLQPGRLKVAGGVGALLACGGAGVTVAADQHPASAPLRPAVIGASAPQATAAAGTGLVIPPSPVCSAGAAALTTDPQLAAIVQQLRQAPTPAARRHLLVSLPADQRQQVTALLRRQAAAPVKKGGPSCLGGSGGDAGGGTISPSVSAAGPSSSPLTFTYVS